MENVTDGFWVILISSSMVSQVAVVIIVQIGLWMESDD